MVIATAPAAVAALITLAAALLAWPRSPRLAGAGGRVEGGAGRRRARPVGGSARPWGGAARAAVRRASLRVGRSALVWSVAAVGGAVACLVAPWSVAVAATMAGVTVTALVRRARRAARRRTEISALAGALHALVRELRAGTQPAVAAARVIEDGGRLVAELLTAVPAPGGIHGTSESAGPHLRAAGGRIGTSGVAQRHRAVVERVARAWYLSDRYGVPLAALIGACAAELEDRAALLRLRAGQVAGPAVSGYVLAALPLAGVALGSGMGANPVAVLTGGGIGGVLLVVGVALCCAGMVWTGRIVHGGGAEE